jgi:hypothetical protein
MKTISNFGELLEACKGMSPAERKMPVQVGTATGLMRVRSIGHCDDAPDAGTDTMILETA